MGQVHAMVEDRLGFLWIGAETGLVRFDGRSFRTMSPPRFGAVVSLDFDPSGRLWFAMRKNLGGGIFSLHHGHTALETALTGLTGPEVAALKVDAAGSVWVRSSRGLFEKKGNNVRRLGGKEGLQGGVPTAMAVVRGSLWVATSEGLFAAKENAFERVSTDRGVTAFDVDEKGWIWLVRDQASPLSIRKGTELFSPPPEVVDELSPVARDILHFDGGAILATASGFVWTDGHKVEPYRLPDVPHDFNALSLFVDGHENLWVGTDFEGLVQIKRAPMVRTFAQPDATRSPIVFSLAIDKHGAVWTTTPYGLGRWLNDRWEAFDIPRAMQIFTPRSLSLAPDGSHWISTLAGGVVRFANGQFTRLTKEDGITTNEIFSVFHDRAGNLLMGITNGGLLRQREGRFEIVPGSREVCPGTAVSFAQDFRGDVWLATAGAGLCRYDGTSVQAWTTREGLPENDLRAVYFDRGGILWIGCNRLGLALRRGDKIEGVPLDLGLNLEEVASIAQDQGGFIWLGTPLGLFRIVPDDVLAVLAKQRTSVRTLRLGVEDGLRSGTFMGQWPASVARGTDGSLWFPNMRGLVQVASPAAVATAQLPTPLIEQLLINGIPLAKAGAEVATGSGNIELSFAAADLEHHSRLQFWYMLEGQDRVVDRAWRYSGEQRTVLYANLAPGAYKMKVAVRTEDRDDEQVATLKFRLVPPFYRTYAFFIACGLAAGLLLLGAYRLRIWQVRDRFNAVMSDRSRIARDMHDTLEQGLIAMKLQTESMLKHPDDSEDVKLRALRMQDLIGESLRDAKSSVWALRAEASANTDLATALSVVAGWMLRGTEVKFELEKLGKPCRLQPEAQQQVVRIVQEALNNAVKHGAPETIVLRLDFSSGDVRVALADDGRGFDGAKAAGPQEGHFGLTGMRERAAQIGAQVQIQSNAGSGTMVTVVIPKHLRRGTASTISV